LSDIDEKKRMAAAMAWRQGMLFYKLDANQRAMYQAYRTSPHKLFVYDVARRVGKSTLMSLIAVEDCLRRPKAMVKYGAPTQEMVREIIIPLISQLAEDAPDELRPRWTPTENAFVFDHNGSRMKLVGLETHADRLRGTALDSAFLDEAAFVEQLEYVIQSILVPQMQGRSWSKILMGSTPPRSPSHAWSRIYVPQAKLEGAYIHRTIMHNPRLSDGEKQFFIKQAGGMEGVENRRENFAEHVVDEDAAIVPEFTKEEANIIKEFERPSHFDAYVSMDPGFNDLTVVLFGFVDFERNKLCIEDEISLTKTNTQTLAARIRKKELELWANHSQQSGKANPVARYSDIELRLIADLSTQHGLSFVPTPKDGKEAAINALRTAVIRHELEIHPRCKTLISHLRYGIWNKNRTSFDRSGDYGHFDAVDAMVYFVRNVPKWRNPFPRFMNGESHSTHHIRRSSEKSEMGQKLKKAFQKRRWG
jgi:hypothetical protein